MPANAPQRVGPRSPLPQASTGFEIAHVPQEKPTDPYSATAAASPASDLMNSLGILSHNVVPVVIKAGEQWAEEQKKRGAQSRMVGDALAPSKSNAFVDGFERMDGTYRGIQFGNAAKEYAIKNTHLNAEEFQKGLDDLQTEYVGKLVHQGQVDTFLPDALKAGEQAASIYQEAKNAAISQERDQKVEDIYKGKMTIREDQRAAEILGIPLSKGLGSIATDPEMRARYDANIEPFRIALAQDYREIVESAVSDYKSLGMTPRQLREKAAARIGRRGEDIGAEALLDVAYQKDASGMTMETAFPKMINAHADKARATGEHISNAMVLRADKAKKAADEKKAGDWLVALANPDITVEAANQIKNDVQNESTMDSDKREKIMNHAVDVMLGQGYARKDNMKVAGDLEYQIRMGKLSGGTANMAVLAAAPKLSLPTVRHLYAIAKERQDKSGDHTWGMFNHEANTYLSSIRKDLGLTDDLGRMMINLNIQGQSMLAQVVQDGTNEWFRGVDSLYKEHDGPFDGALLSQLRERIIKSHTPEKEKIAKYYLATGGDMPKSSPKDTNVYSPSVVKKSASSVTSSDPSTVIPQGFVDSGKTVGGKPVYQSPDGTQSIVVN